jgi:hypothetical protein
MSYKVPPDSFSSTPWPHWYSLVSLAFHSLIIVRGISIIWSLQAAGRSFGGWHTDQQILFGLSIGIALMCVISSIRKTNAGGIVRANFIYSLTIALTISSHIGLFHFEGGSTVLFSGIGDITVMLMLANFIYSVYRLFTRRKPKSKSSPSIPPFIRPPQ